MSGTYLTGFSSIHLHMALSYILIDINLSITSSLSWIFISLFSWFSVNIYTFLSRLPTPHPEFSLNSIFFCLIILFFNCPLILWHIYEEIFTMIPYILFTPPLFTSW